MLHKQHMLIALVVFVSLLFCQPLCVNVSACEPNIKGVTSISYENTVYILRYEAVLQVIRMTDSQKYIYMADKAGLEGAYTAEIYLHDYPAYSENLATEAVALAILKKFTNFGYRVGFDNVFYIIFNESIKAFVVETLVSFDDELVKLVYLIENDMNKLDTSTIVRLCIPF